MLTLSARLERELEWIIPAHVGGIGIGSRGDGKPRWGGRPSWAVGLLRGVRRDGRHRGSGGPGDVESLCYGCWGVCFVLVRSRHSACQCKVRVLGL